MKRTLGILAGLSCLLFSAVSSAEVTGRVEGGAAIPVTEPQSDRFDSGVHAAVKGMVGITPFFDIGPSFSVLALPSTIPGIDTGTAFGFGGTLRVKRPHDHENNTGEGFSAASPWVDGDLQYIRTDELNRAGVAVSGGVAFPTSDERNLWIGPLVRYQNIFQTEKQGFDTSDGRMLIIGLGIEFGPSQNKAVTPPPKEPTPQEPSDRDHDGTPDATDHCPDVPGPKDNFGCPLPEPKPPVQTPERVEVQGKVQFDWDSAVLRSNEKTALDEAAKTLLAHKGYKVKVDGHASSEGQVEHNNKLAKKRAEAVAAYLVSKGVPADSITTTGFGSRVPVATNTTEEGRVANRRVEFVVNFVIVKE